MILSDILKVLNANRNVIVVFLTGRCFHSLVFDTGIPCDWNPYWISDNMASVEVPEVKY